MSDVSFRTPDGTDVPSVTASEMREVDRIAVEEVGLQLLQMMENAGRNLAGQCRQRHTDGEIVIVAGSGGNGGGGLACGRHLANRGLSVSIVLDRPPAELQGAVETQYRILDEMDIEVTTDAEPIDRASLLVDALIGYGLHGPPRGRALELIEASNRSLAPRLSLDIPSGYDATTGEAPAAAITPDQTMTLALPKTGLSNVPGELLLADIAIPAVVYQRLDIPYENPFVDGYRLPIEITENGTA
ncbi:MAG: NAD(P)H-hydrate epimerase [Halobacteriales archaeon]|nr:NAD(P)H-hydrate epimerase [Halobacteriales archaeon]